MRLGRAHSIGEVKYAHRRQIRIIEAGIVIGNGNQWLAIAAANTPATEYQTTSTIANQLCNCSAEEVTHSLLVNRSNFHLS